MDDGRDLLDGILLVVVEVDRLAVFQGQGHDKLQDAFRTGLEFAVGGAHRRDGLRYVVECDGALPVAAPQKVFRGVDGDADDPRALVLGGVEAPCMTERFEEDVLADVLGVLRAAQVGVAHTENRVRVRFDESVRLRLDWAASRVVLCPRRLPVPISCFVGGGCAPSSHILTSLSELV